MMFNSYNRLRNIKTTAKSAALGILIGGSILLCEYCDLPGPSGFEAGRTKNTIATVVAGIVGQKMYGNSEIDIKIKKHLFPSAQITGYTTPGDIDTNIDLAITSSHFTAHNNVQGQLEGEVAKSEFNWEVKQAGPDSYHIKRFGLKFDSELVLHLYEGRITGNYLRPGPHFNWEIKGTYDQDGKVDVEIDGPVNLGITLEGTITRNYLGRWNNEIQTP